jgi:hypothetical protein
MKHIYQSLPLFTREPSFGVPDTLIYKFMSFNNEGFSLNIGVSTINMSFI